MRIESVPSRYQPGNHAVILHDDCVGCTPGAGVDEACRRCELWAHAAGLDMCAECAHVYPLTVLRDEGDWESIWDILRKGAGGKELAILLENGEWE